MLILFRKILIFTGILLTIALFNSSADACSCYRPRTVDKEFAEKPNVVVVKLQSFKDEENAPTKFFFSVEKVFKGGLKPAEILTFQNSLGCSLGFSKEEVGTDFLLYLGDRPAKDQFWTATYCSRSGTIEARKNDLRYLENEAKLRGKTRLSGRIEKWVYTLDELVETTDFPLANRKIRIVGSSGKTFTATTDETGAFEIYDLLPGKYKVYPGKLEGFTFQEEKTGFEEVEIKAKSQTEQDFYYRINNAIGGKIIDRDGKPLEEINVDLYSLKLEKILGVAHQSTTDENGEFEISAIPEGTYKIVVNGENPFNRFSRSPLFEPFYYPNAETLEKAAEITVEPNFFMRNLILVPPAQPEMMSVSGKVIFADGKPAAKQVVVFLTEDQLEKARFSGYESAYQAETDKNGEFTIQFPKGRTGILRSVFYYTRITDKDKNCPEIEEIAKEKDTNFLELETSRFEINKDADLTAVELRFPFSNCVEKAK